MNSYRFEYQDNHGMWIPFTRRPFKAEREDEQTLLLNQGRKHPGKWRLVRLSVNELREIVA